MDDILVSVVCMAYNHEKFIRDTLEGILHQNVHFKYEVIVHDDASTDRTPQILREYEERYPEKMKVIYEIENQFSLRGGPSVSKDLLNMCNGKYIALCECDDCWIDTHKLKIQIEWMEAHPDYFMTAHNALRINYQNNTLQAINPYVQDKEISPEELIMQYNGNLPTASIIMKAEIKNMGGFFLECGVGDIPMQLYSLSKGRIYYFDRIMSVYRYHHAGSWCVNTLSGNDQSCILHYAKMIRFAHEYDRYTERTYNVFMVDLALQYLFAILFRCKHMEISDFRKKVEMLQDKSDAGLREYLDDITEAYKQFYSETYISEKLRKYIACHQTVYIYGTGRYGTLLTEKMVKQSLVCDGFVVSDDFDAAQEHMGKPVYRLSELCGRNGDTGIIVAVNQTLWKEIRDKLEERSMTEYSYMICI